VIETAGNLIPYDGKSASTGASADQQPLIIHFTALKQNRLAFLVRLRDLHADPSGQIMFMKDSSPAEDTKLKGRALPICVLSFTLPDVLSKITLHASDHSSSLNEDDDVKGGQGGVVNGGRTPGMDLIGRGVADIFNKSGLLLSCLLLT